MRGDVFGSLIDTLDKVENNLALAGTRHQRLVQRTGTPRRAAAKEKVKVAAPCSPARTDESCNVAVDKSNKDIVKAMHKLAKNGGVEVRPFA